MTNVGILGFGRIGRSLFRILHDHPTIRLAVIRDVAEADQLQYLLRFDTILGRFPEPVSIADEFLRVGDRRIRILTGKASDAVPWGELGVDTVFESTSQTRSPEQLQAHLAAGARRVIVCGPTREPCDALAVAGLTDDRIEPRHRIVSIASPTVQCVAPPLRVLQDAFGIRRAVFTAVHSYTSAHHLADAPSADLRRGRAAAANIVPQSSRSEEMLVELLPELSGRLSGFALNVPAHNGSAVDLVCWHEKDVSVETVREAFRAAAEQSRWARSLDVTPDPIVSSDVTRSTFSSTFDSLATMTLSGRVSKTLSWFDAGFSFAQRAVDLAERFAQREGAP
ncbi:MAG: glyceraldehyde 3-phosphate dehydrogenase NAD-binding domain-containing protein [Acidobacteriota bacterium]